MKLRAWTSVAVVAATVAAAGLGVALSSTRAGRAETYARERAAQRRAASATRPMPAPTPVAPIKEAPACVTGADTFAVAMERWVFPLPPAGNRQRRVAALRQLSAEAVRAERSAELARPAPTLPKRMGLRDGEPVTPEALACDGKGFAELR